jgi:hypothetical protein
MTDPAVFQGALVNLKNSPTHKSIVLQIEVPEEYGEAIVRAFGWPTRVKPLSVAVARLEGEPPRSAPEPIASPRPFDSLSPAEQAGMICKEPDFAEFLRTTAPYRYGPEFTGLWTPSDLVRDACGVKSRAEIREGTEAHRQWRVILERYRFWQDERDRLDVDF